MVDVITAEATIAKLAKGYRVIVEIRKGARAYVLVNKIAASTIDAEAIAKKLAQFLGIPLNLEEMTRQVDASLYRNRSK